MSGDWATSIGWGCPRCLQQVIDTRVARLGEEMSLPLSIAAVIGQEVSLSLWAEVAGLDDETILTVVEKAAEAHLLEAERDGRGVRFVHAPCYLPAAGNGISASGKRWWHVIMPIQTSWHSIFRRPEIPGLLNG